MKLLLDNLGEVELMYVFCYNSFLKILLKYNYYFNAIVYFQRIYYANDHFNESF